MGIAWALAGHSKVQGSTGHKALRWQDECSNGNEGRCRMEPALMVLWYQIRSVIIGSQLTGSLGPPRHSSYLDDADAPPKPPQILPD